MRVLALGGAGAMGRGALGAAAADAPPWTHLTIADRDELAARDVAAVLPAAIGRSVDATDHAALGALMSDHDVVVSTIGPYYRFGDSVLSLAIETGTHYIDICDDWQPTVEMLERDEQARAAAVTAVIGAGASPGISNMLAVVASDHLDATHTLLTGWGSAGLGLDSEPTAGEGGSARAAFEHWVKQCTGDIRVWRDGGEQQVRPLAGVALEFPGVGRISGRTVGHPEPVTLPRTIQGLRHCMNVMDMPAGLISILAREAAAVEAGTKTVGEAADVLVAFDSDPLRSSSTARFFAGVARDVITRRRFAPELYALAIGRRAGRPISVAASLGRSIPGGMAPMTGIPLAITLDLLTAGKINRHGVMAPEACVRPADFFAALRRFATKGVDPAGPGVVRLHSTEPDLDGAWAGEPTPATTARAHEAA